MRYKEFSNNKVLEDCISLFWKKGFTGTSITTVVDSTKVNRFSLYKEFDNKEGILLASLQLYRERYASVYQESLKNQGKVIQTIKDFYYNYLKDKQGHPPGCYIVYISTELADTKTNIHSSLIDYLSDLEQKFITLLKTDEKYLSDVNLITEQLIGLFCNSVCYCYIQEEQERMDFIDLNLNLILNK